MLRPLPLLTLDVREGRAEGEGGVQREARPPFQNKNKTTKRSSTALHNMTATNVKYL